MAAELGISPPTVAKWRKRFSFDGAGPAEPVEAGGDRVLVAAQTSDERVQAGQVVAEHTSNPGFELSATAVHHDLGEVTDMLTQGFQSGTPEGARPGARGPSPRPARRCGARPGSARPPG
ncbi:hypothetical protein ABZ806_28100 [Spirillospora sp. NPDC047418]